MITHSVRLVRRALNRARIVVVLIVVLHTVGGLLFSFIESKSVFDGQWWANVTGFTVGYGDLYPQTAAGRILAMIYIPSMAILWLIVAAHIVAVIIEDKHLFTNEEQERLEACILELAQKFDIVPPEFTSLPGTQWFAEHHEFKADAE